MATTIKTTFQLRRGNAEVWAKNNPILAAGEPGFELDTGKLKIGNGSDAYNNLPYLSADDVAVLLEDKVSKAGDTMTGFLSFKCDTSILHEGSLGGALFLGGDETGINIATIAGYSAGGKNNAIRLMAEDIHCDGTLKMENFKIVGLYDGDDPQDAVNYKQLSEKVSKKGDTMTGDLKMADGSGVVKGSLSDIVDGVALSAENGACVKVAAQAVTVCDNTGGTSQIKGVKTPVDDNDAANKKYVDGRLFTFTITPTNGPGSQMLSATRAEMLAALDAGKTLLGYWTETRTILETTDTIKHEFRLESVSGTGADRGLAFVNYEQFYKSTLYVNGNDTVSFVNKEQLPNPTTKTEAMIQSVGMDNDGRLWTEPGASGSGVTTLHINITAVNAETMEATFTADKTPNEMLQASLNGPTWCVVTFEAGTMEDHAVSIGLPPAWKGFESAFGLVIEGVHQEDGNNKVFYAVSQGSSGTWIVNLSAFHS